jgi:ribonuclease P protein component
MADQGFPASGRLLTSSEFDAVFKKNQIKISTPEFLFLVADNQVEQSRLGMVVSKKNTSHAVDRNQLKRLVREVFRKTQMAPVDVVVLTRTGANKQSNQALIRVLEKSFYKITTRINDRTMSNKEAT